ncbi:MAG: LysM peptidoglycan-binding domain-containing protein, partial [Arenimonas sp.]
FAPLAAILVGRNAGSLDNIAKQYQIDAERLKKNNPAYKRGHISTNSPRRILMPAHLGNVQIADASGDKPENSAPVETIASNPAPVETHSGSHQVKSGDTLWSVAKRYGLSLGSLQKLNGLGRNAVLRVGQTLKLSP